ncbi:MAG: 4Fe-4S dicluster domain-containing protein [Pseudomonadota bacterium]
MKKPEIKGFRVETCFGATNCPNRAVESGHLVERITQLLEAENLLAFLRSSIPKPLKYHHEIRVAVADCPNACSQPQIRDIGILGGVLPIIADISCTGCGTCSLHCQEHAIAVDAETRKPILDFESCLKCGQCVSVCPTHALVAEKKGFRIQVGGKLGRHPKLAAELPGFYDEDEAVSIVSAYISFYKEHAKAGQRFGSVINFNGDPINGENLYKVRCMSCHGDKGQGGGSSACSC